MKNRFYVFLLFTIINSSGIFSQIKFCSSDEIINYGLTHSKSITLSKASAKEEFTKAKLSVNSFLPQISFNWNEYDDINISGSDTKTKSIDFELTQKLFDNGKSILQYKYNKYNAWLSVLNSNLAAKEYSISILEKYYNYILTCNLINIQQELLESNLNELSVIEYEYENGLALKSDYLEYKINCQELKNSISNQLEEKNRIYNDLKFMLNLTPGTELIIDENISESQTVYEKLINQENILFEQIKDQNLKLKQQNASIDFQKQQIKISNRFFLPTVSLAFGINFSGKSYPLTQPGFSLKCILSFDALPFFPTQFSNNEVIKENRLKTISNSSQTTFIPQIEYFSNRKLIKFELDKAINEKETLLNELNKKATDYIQENNSKIDLINLLEESIQLKQEKLLISEYQVKEGLLTTTDYLKEKNSLSEAKQNLMSAKIKLIILRKKLSLETTGNLRSVYE